MYLLKIHKTHSFLLIASPFDCFKKYYLPRTLMKYDASVKSPKGSEKAVCAFSLLGDVRDGFQYEIEFRGSLIFNLWKRTPTIYHRYFGSSGHCKSLYSPLALVCLKSLFFGGRLEGVFFTVWIHGLYFCWNTVTFKKSVRIAPRTGKKKMFWPTSSLKLHQEKTSNPKR